MNSASYCEVLLKRRDAIRRKLPGHLGSVLLLHHDSARAHAAQATQERVQNLQFELIEIRLRARTWPLVTSICLFP
jgi:hypothetical protein